MTRRSEHFRPSTHRLVRLLAVLSVGLGTLLLSLPAPGQDGEKGSPEEKEEGQYRKNDSPSGVQLGVADKQSTGSLPAELEALAKEGALASADRDWKKAREAYQKMVDKAPDNALALANLGMVEYRLKDFDNARKHLQASLIQQPRNAQNWLALALTDFQTGERDLALSSLFRAKAVDPTDPRVHLYIAVIVRDYGWTVAAETELRRAIALDPDYADAHFNLALMYLEKTPPAIELAKRHYYIAVDLGAKPDKEVEAQLEKSPEKDEAKAEPKDAR